MIDKAKLLKSRLAETTVDIPGIGTVRVRGLSRAEALAAQNLKGAAAIERRMLALALVDPVMTEAEVGEWQAAAPAGELEPVTDKIQELSGMTQGAAKEAYRAFEEDPDAEFRVLPRAETGDDGGGAQG